MSRNTRLVVPIPVAVFLALSLSACGKDNFKTTTLKLTEKDTNDFGFADAPPRTRLGKDGPQTLSPGDTLSFRSELLDSSKKAVGELGGACVVTHAGDFRTAKSQCTATASVPGGSLFLTAGGAVFAGDTRGSIAGGTGDYAGAGGTFVSAESNQGSHDTFNVQIPQK